MYLPHKVRRVTTYVNCTDMNSQSRGGHTAPYRAMPLPPGKSKLSASARGKGHGFSCTNHDSKKAGL